MMSQEACSALQQQADEQPEPLALRTSQWLPGAGWQAGDQAKQRPNSNLADADQEGKKKDFYWQQTSIDGTSKMYISRIHFRC